jgi:hypothetical protein
MILLGAPEKLGKCKRVVFANEARNAALHHHHQTLFGLLVLPFSGPTYKIYIKSSICRSCIGGTKPLSFALVDKIFKVLTSIYLDYISIK